jgi:hypothetical protein
MISPLLFVTPENWELLKKIKAGTARLEYRWRKFTVRAESFKAFWLKEKGQKGDWLSSAFDYMWPAMLVNGGYLSISRNGKVVLARLGKKLLALGDPPEMPLHLALVKALADGMPMKRGSYYKSKPVAPGNVNAKWYTGAEIFSEWRPLMKGNFKRSAVEEAARKGWITQDYTTKVYTLTEKGKKAAKRDPAPEVKLETRDGKQCNGCQKVFEDGDELEPVYECGSCGEEFTRDESSDGDSNRCPSCNKFAAKSDDKAKCPDCGDDVEDVTLVKHPKTGEWVNEDDYDEDEEEDAAAEPPTGDAQVVDIQTTKR